MDLDGLSPLNEEVAEQLMNASGASEADRQALLETIQTLASQLSSVRDALLGRLQDLAAEVQGGRDTVLRAMQGQDASELTVRDQVLSQIAAVEEGVRGLDGLMQAHRDTLLTALQTQGGDVQGQLAVLASALERIEQHRDQILAGLKGPASEVQAGRDSVLQALQGQDAVTLAVRDQVLAHISAAIERVQDLGAQTQAHRDTILSAVQNQAGDAQGQLAVIAAAVERIETHRDQVLARLQGQESEVQAARDSVLQALQAQASELQGVRDSVLQGLQGRAGDVQASRDVILQALQGQDAVELAVRDQIFAQISTAIARVEGLEGQMQAHRDSVLSVMQTQGGDANGQMAVLAAALERIELRLARREDGGDAALDRLTAAVAQINRTGSQAGSSAGARSRTAAAPVSGELPQACADFHAVKKVLEAPNGRVVCVLGPATLSAGKILDLLLELQFPDDAPAALIFRDREADGDFVLGRQIFGLLGRAAGCARIDLDDGPATIVWGRSRRRAALFSVLWREEDFLSASERQIEQWRASHAKFPGALLPLVVLPDAPEALTDAWIARAGQRLAPIYRASSTFGVAWPRAVLNAPEADLVRWTRGVDALKRRLADDGLDLKVQMVSGALSAADSSHVLSLARRFGIELDLSVSARGEAGAHFQAYRDLEPYRPAAFDMRLQDMSGSAAPNPTCVARRAIGIADAKDGRGAFAFDAARQRMCDRLERVLDEQSAARVRERVRRDVSAAQGLWERYIIYNWAPPMGGWAHALTAEANDLCDPGSPSITALQHLRDDGVLLAPAQFLDAIEADAALAPMAVEENHALQIEAHAYLLGRDDASPDSLAILDWLPARIGRMLEIGAGYGVLAKRIIERADAFFALELTPAQAEVLEALGATAKVGDMHDLPFDDGAFDTILADNVIEHATDPVRALSELARVMAPDGRAYVVMPLDYFSADYANTCHHWKADEASIRSALALAGLRVCRSRVAHYSEFGLEVGSNPACGGFTSLWEIAHA